MKPLELTGQRFGWLTVIERAPEDGTNRTLWLCQCGCGKRFVAYGYYITNGSLKSCGCRKLLWNRRYMLLRKSGDRELYDFLNTAEELPDWQEEWIN